VAGLLAVTGAIPVPDRLPVDPGQRLYAYIADTAPGQAHGNNLDLNGGLWHEVTVSG
jgi:hypothetical protein